MDGESSLSGIDFCFQLFNLALILLILILILTIDEAVGEDAAEEERDCRDIDCNVVDGNIHCYSISFLGLISISERKYVRVLLPTTNNSGL